MRTAILAFLLLAAGSPAVAQQRVGTTAAVNPATTGTPPGGVMRVLQVGNDVVFEERIATSPSGQTQLLFLDQSSLTVGPNAEVVLDRFVYDPATSTGEMALSITKGVFRFVGGRISANSGATIRTPTATLGIRGSVVLGNAEPLDAVFVAGRELTVTNPLGQIRFDQNDAGRRVAAGQNAPPQDLGVADGQTLRAFLQPLQSTGTGGAAEKPTEDRAAGGGVGMTAAGLQPPDMGPSVQRAERQKEQTVEAGGGSVTPPPSETLTGLSGRYYSTPGTGGERGYVGPYPTAVGQAPGSFKAGFTGGRVENGRFTAEVDLQGPLSTFAAPVSPGTFSFDETGTESPFGPIAGTGFFDPDARFGFFEVEEVDFADEFAFLFFGLPLRDSVLTPSGPRAFGVQTFDLRGDPLLASGIPFLRGSGGGAVANPDVSPLYIATRALPAAENAVSTGLQASLGIEGQGSAQKSVLAVHTGRFFIDGEGHVAYGGGFAASARLGAGERAVFSNGGAEAVPAGTGERFFGSGSTIEHFVLSNDLTVGGAYRERNAFEQPYDFQTNPGAPEFGTNYGYVHVASRTSTPSGVGATRSSRTMRGYAGGVGETRQRSGDADVFPSPYALSNRTDSPTDVTITTNAATNRLEATFDLAEKAPSGAPTVASATFQFGGLTTANAARSSFVDDNIFAARDNAGVASRVNGKAAAPDEFGFQSNGLMVSQAVVPTRNFLPEGVRFCACEFLEWGYWSYEFRFPDATGPDAFRRERIHLGNWVAGELADPSAVAGLHGEASYSGHAIGSVVNNNNRYSAVGNFTKSWNFDTRRGSVTISNFDGATYTGATQSMNARDWNGSLSGAGRSGTVAGSFVKGGADPAREVMGRFNIGSRGAGYSASGILAGKKGARN